MSLIELNPSDMFGPRPDVIIPCSGCWIAGGAIRSWFIREESPDIDVFFFSDNEMQKFKEINNLKEPNYSNEIVSCYNTPNKKQIQLIKLFYGNILTLFESFDYTICQFGWGIFDGKEKIYSTGPAIVSISNKTLKINKIIKSQAFNVFKRAFKYQRKGYIPDNETLKTIAEALSNLTVEDITKSVPMSPTEVKMHVELVKNKIQKDIENSFNDPIAQLEL